MKFNKRAYIEPKDAPAGVPCRFCDMPSNVDGLGPVLQDGLAIDKKRPLFSHGYCLMNSGGKKQDDYDFSLQDLLPESLVSLYHNDVEGSAENNTWAFASKMRFISHEEANGITETDATPKVKRMTRKDKPEEYDDDDTGAPTPPSK